VLVHSSIACTAGVALITLLIDICCSQHYNLSDMQLSPIGGTEPVNLLNGISDRHSRKNGLCIIYHVTIASYLVIRTIRKTCRLTGLSRRICANIDHSDLDVVGQIKNVMHRI